MKELIYIRANRCASLYDSLLALRGWQRQEINGIEYELNSIITEKWEGKSIALYSLLTCRCKGNYFRANL